MDLQEPYPLVAEREANRAATSGAIAYLRNLAVVLAIELPQPVLMLTGIGMLAAGHTETQKGIGGYGLVGTSFIIGTARSYLHHRREFAPQIDTPEAS